MDLLEHVVEDRSFAAEGDHSSGLSSFVFEDRLKSRERRARGLALGQGGLETRNCAAERAGADIWPEWPG